MARVFQSGFEFNSTAADGEWTAASGTPSITVGAARSGTYGLEVGSLASGTAKRLDVRLLSTGAATARYFARCYVRVTALPAAAGSTFLAFTQASSGAVPVLWCRLTSTGTIELRDEDGVVGTSATALSADDTTWYRIEIELNGAPAAGSDVVTLRIDGTDEVTSSARTIDTAHGRLAVGGNLNGEANTSGGWDIDDVAINDATGSVQNSFPGDGKIVMLFATSDGDTTNRGTQGTHWETRPTTGQTAIAQVDDAPTADDATTYFELLDASASLTDPPVMWFGFQSLTSKGADSDDTITLVAVRARHGSTTGARRHYPIIRTGSSEYDGTLINANSTAWLWDNSTNPFWSQRVNYVNPSSLAAWSLADIDAIQGGVRANSDVTPAPRFTQIAIDVEYVPVTGGGGGGGKPWFYYARQRAA